jgi:hypothetical protein
MAEDQQHRPCTETSHLQSLFFRKDPCNQRKIFRGLATSWSLVSSKAQLRNCLIYWVKAKSDTTWLVNNFVKYLQGHSSKVGGKEITGSTLMNNIRQ